MDVERLLAEAPSSGVRGHLEAARAMHALAVGRCSLHAPVSRADGDGGRRNARRAGECESSAALLNKALVEVRKAAILDAQGEERKGIEKLEARLRLDRAKTLVLQAQLYTTRPAELSERGGALMGQDPDILIERALRDAVRVGKMQDGETERDSYVIASRAALKLGRPHDARRYALDALAATGEDDELANGALEEATATLRASVPPSDAEDNEDATPSKRVRHTSDSGNLDCTVCMQILWEPCTTPCGHTFCRPCLTSGLRHRAACPLCRRPMHGQTPPITVALWEHIQRCFPDEISARREDDSPKPAPPTGEGAAGSPAEAAAGPDEPVSLGLFVMDILMPGATMRLNIFEPRYRLLVRRALESTRPRIGMAAAQPSGGVYPIFVEASIEECEPQADGRFLLKLRGERAMRVSSLTETDGYRTAVAEPVAAEDANTPDAEMDAELEGHVREMCTNLWDMLKSHHGDAIRELRDTIGGDVPAGAVALSWWAARLLSSLGALDVTTKQSLLCAHRPSDRLRLLEELMTTLEAGAPAGGRGRCAVM